MGGHKFPVRTCMILWLFWIILVGRSDGGSFALGLIVAFIVSWVDRDIVVERGKITYPSRTVFWGWLRYLASLLIAMIKANVQVAGIVLRPRLAIEPTIATFRTRLQTDMGKMILGNSITLTPGTVTVEVDDDLFVVHGLTLRHARGLADRSMESILVELEEGGLDDE